MNAEQHRKLEDLKRQLRTATGQKRDVILNQIDRLEHEEKMLASSRHPREVVSLEEHEDGGGFIARIFRK